MCVENERFYLGISFGFNSSACVVSDKRGVLAAISQERLNGIKNTKEIPVEALLACCKIAEVDSLQVIAISHYQKLTIGEIRKYVSDKYRDFAEQTNSVNAFFINILKENGIKIGCNNLFRVNHHTAHAYSGFGTYGMKKDCYLITSDGFGDGISGRIALNNRCVYETISEVKLRNSVALVYQFVTGALGYKMHQHEGKITGLAAFGKPIYLNEFYDLFNKSNDGNGLDLKLENALEFNNEQLEMLKTSTIQDFDEFLKFKQIVFDLVYSLKAKGASDEDIAASLQEFTEEVTTSWILNNVNTDSKLPCYLAGGLFANVKLNQRIKDLGIFSEVLVSPAMGDEGTSIGSAIFAIDLLNSNYQDDLNCVQSINKVCIGTKINKGNFVDECVDFHEKNKEKVSMKFINDGTITSVVAKFLEEKKIVCLCKGRLEFGPRALCNRSILYDCTDKSVNDWLNKQLGRTEFMPFAPVCLREDAEDLFFNFKGGEQSASFMTMTFDCKDEFVTNYPAACHVDNTARPQLVTEESDFTMYDILTKYKKDTGKKVLINTSFNLHNNPIIENAKVAMESWLTSNTDVLVLDNVVFERKDK